MKLSALLANKEETDFFEKYRNHFADFNTENFSSLFEQMLKVMKPDDTRMTIMADALTWSKQFSNLGKINRFDLEQIFNPFVNSDFNQVFYEMIRLASYNIGALTQINIAFLKSIWVKYHSLSSTGQTLVRCFIILKIEAELDYLKFYSIDELRRVHKIMMELEFSKESQYLEILHLYSTKPLFDIENDVITH